MKYLRYLNGDAGGVLKISMFCTTMNMLKTLVCPINMKRLTIIKGQLDGFTSCNISYLCGHNVVVT